MKTTRWLRTGAALLLAGAALLRSAPARADGAVDEYAVKAAFLVHFITFVESPDDDGVDVVGISVVEPDPFGKVLDRGAASAGVVPALSVLRVPAGSAPPRSRILFVSARSGEAGLRSLEQAPAGTLTVGETKEFMERGGLIRLSVSDGRVRIEVNAEAARQAGLRVSSKLLRVAIPWPRRDRT